MKKIELTNKQFELLKSIIEQLLLGIDNDYHIYYKQNDEKIFEDINNKFKHIKNKRLRKIKWNSPDCY